MLIFGQLLRLFFILLQLWWIIVYRWRLSLLFFVICLQCLSLKYLDFVFWNEVIFFFRYFFFVNLMALYYFFVFVFLERLAWQLLYVVLMRFMACFLNMLIVLLWEFCIIFFFEGLGVLVVMLVSFMAFVLVNRECLFVCCSIIGLLVDIVFSVL